MIAIRLLLAMAGAAVLAFVVAFVATPLVAALGVRGIESCTSAAGAGGGARMTTRASFGVDLEAPATEPSRPRRVCRPPNTTLAANRHARRGATSGRGKCQPPATERGGAATETSSPSRRRSPRAWATQNTRRSRKHKQHEVRAVSPAPLCGTATAPSGRGATNSNPADRLDGKTRAILALGTGAVLAFFAAWAALPIVAALVARLIHLLNPRLGQGRVTS